jgi:hypothetical protein
MTGAKMCDRHGNKETTIPLAAFADDTNLFGNNNDNSKTKEALTQEAKDAFSTWNGLLHATGHSMELSKCSCYLQLWKFQEDGYAFTENPEEHQQEIKVSGIDGHFQTIRQLQANESQKLLGVMKNPIGDQQDEIDRLKKKSDNITKKINSNKLSRTDAKIAYEVFYLPAVRYSLNITSRNQMDLETVQSKAVMAFLAAQGFNRHMPREIVFAPTIFQGLGLRHLYDLQGSDTTRLLLQELNQEGSMTQRMLLILLDTIQLESGIGQPILENCKALEYLEWGWIPQIRDFLWHIKGQIIGATMIPPIYRKNDSYLMDSTYLEGLSRRDKIYIHRCRIYLQVETVSDITAADGTHIDPVWKRQDSTKPSRSLIRWPRQQAPHAAAWRVWSKFLDSYYNDSGNLKQPLGEWIRQNKTRTHSAYFRFEHECLWKLENNNWYQYALRQKQRKCWVFQATASSQATQPPHTGVPIDIITSDGQSIKTTTAAKQLQDETAQEQQRVWYQVPFLKHPHLTGHTLLLMDPNDIQEIFHEKTHIEIASDGGHD